MHDSRNLKRQVPLSIRRGTFKLPQSPHDPLIMVGPGTGVAPMRGVILERRRQRASPTLTGDDRVGSDQQRGPVLSQPRERGGAAGGGAAVAATTPDTLFFGCR